MVARVVLSLLLAELSVDHLPLELVGEGEFVEEVGGVAVARQGGDLGERTGPCLKELGCGHRI